MEIKIADIMKIGNCKLFLGNKSVKNIECKSFSKDTRTLKDGDIYIGINGENFDGNQLYEEALKKGAAACILQNIDEKKIKETIGKFQDRAIIVVEDTVKALQKIAEYKRNLYNIPVIAVTGSVGKTSTKDMIASVVNTKYKVLKTQENLNNHIGVPLTILELGNHEALVVEIGMNNLGEISLLSKIAKPTIAVITNVGTAHIGNLGSRENIRRAKLEILDGLQEDGTLIINNDNDMLHDWYINDNLKEKEINVITYGLENDSDFIAENIRLLPDSSEFEINNLYNVKVPIGGLHFIYNALCAFTVGKVMNIEANQIIDGINKFSLSKNRMELIKLQNEITIINDCYNANFDSMKAALEYLHNSNGKRKIAVLGDMLELGCFSEDFHRKIGKEVIKNEIDILITVGENAKKIAEEADIQQKYNLCTQIYSFKNNGDALKFIKSFIKQEDIILVKASNGMNFKEIVTELKNYISEV